MCGGGVTNILKGVDDETLARVGRNKYHKIGKVHRLTVVMRLRAHVVGSMSLLGGFR